MSRKRKAESSKVQEDVIKPVFHSLPPYLLEKMNIENYKSMSTMARVYFRENSNINEVLDRYMEMRKRTGKKEWYLTRVIYNSISMGMKDFPYNTFRFHSDYHKCVAMLLYHYPEIKTMEDLRDVQEYLTQQDILTECSVIMTKNNEFRQIEDEYLVEKRIKLGNEVSFCNNVNGRDRALRKYYEDHNLVENVYFDDMTVEDLMNVTNFEKAVNKKLNQVQLSFDELAEVMFMTIKADREFINTYEIYIYPRYNFITNDITPERQAIIGNYHNFYKYTNAKELVRRYKKQIPCDESKDFGLQRMERRRHYFETYLSQDDKKMPPFQHLHWIQEDENSEEVSKGLPQSPAVPLKSVAISSQEAGPSHFWKLPKVCERNQDPELLNEKNDEQAQMNENLNRYIKWVSFTAEQEAVINEIIMLNYVNAAIEKDLKELNLNFYGLWWRMRSKTISRNYTFYKLTEKDESFIELLNDCSDSIKSALLDVFQIDLNAPINFGEPVASSTQSNTTENAAPDEAAPNVAVMQFQNSTDSIEDVIIADEINNNANEQQEPKVIVIKNEILANPTSVFSQDSDVMIVLPNSSPEIIELDDSENFEPNIVTSPNLRMDKYQQNLNADSQLSDSTVAVLKNDYQLRSRELLLQNVNHERRRRVSARKSEAGSALN